MSQLDSLLVLPRPLEVDGRHYIEAPSESEFADQFGALDPAPDFLTSALGTIAYYRLHPQNTAPESQTQRVLFIHGLGTPAVGLLPLVRRLQASNPNLNILLYDLWGHGLSQTPLVPHVPALFHSQILDLLHHINWPSAHVVGYSFGGTTAVSFTSFHPEAVKSLAIVAPVGLLRSGDLTEEEQLMIRGGTGLEERARDWALEFSEGGPLVVPEDWEERVRRGDLVAEAIRSWERVHHEGHIASVTAMVRDGNVFDGHDAYIQVARTETKKLAILGELDDLCSVQDLESVGWRDTVVVNGAGHGLVRANVDEVAALLEEFWGRPSP